MKRTNRKIQWLPLLLTLAVLGALLLVACTSGDGGSATEASTTEAVTDVPTEAGTAAVTEPATEGDTDAPETETAAVTEPVTTENPAERINQPTDPAHITFFDPKRPRLNTLFTELNQCTVKIVQDETYGSVLRLTTSTGAADPYVTFKYASYLKGIDLQPISADEYKFIVMTIRAENCTSETFELFYCAGAVQGPTAGYQTTATFDSTETGWQKIVFDLSGAVWTGDINAFRFDFLTSPSGGGEVVYVYSMDFYKTAEEAYGELDVDLTRPGADSDLKEEAVDNVNYDKLTAPDEDASVDLWFDHITEKVYQNVTTSSGLYTYVIHMAGNSIENCQFFLAPDSDRTFSVSLTDFTNSVGNTLRTEVLREHYVNINGLMVPDALPPVEETVTVKGGNSQGFVIKVWTDTAEPAGLYTATLTVTDAENGKVIKTANVYVNVYGFSLSDTTALSTSVGLGDWSVYSSYLNKGMEDKSYEELYKIYYDFLLENRLCAYRLPYQLTDGRVTDYLNNPRVNTFVINKISDNEAQAYDILKDHPEWLKKGYYYYVDEPTNTGLLNELVYYSERLAQNFPGYRQISPFFTNMAVGDGDQIEFMKSYLSIWCTKIFAFTPRDKSMVAGTQYMTTQAQDEAYGTFEERMKALQAKDNELWLYFCWEPGQPYTNWLALGDGTEPIVSIWQCKMTGATGVLYWETAYWNADPMNDLTPLIGAAAHGDGVLLYSGAAIGSYEPISSFRLENVRNGIQDYQLLTMLEEAAGTEVVDKLVAMVTTDVITYTNDDDYLKAVRVLLFEEVAEALS